MLHAIANTFIIQIEYNALILSSVLKFLDFSIKVGKYSYTTEPEKGSSPDSAGKKSRDRADEDGKRNKGITIKTTERSLRQQRRPGTSLDLSLYFS